jgi:hypothetical protein
MRNTWEKYRRDFERRVRKGYAEAAEEKCKIWLFLFCVFCVIFAPSAFKKYFACLNLTHKILRNLRFASRLSRRNQVAFDEIG